MKQLSASLNNDDLLTQNIYKPPAIVMSTAATPVNVSAPLQLYWNADNVNDQYYLYLHFNEVEKLAVTEIREFNVIVNRQLFARSMIPMYGNVTTLYNPTPFTGTAKHFISLSKTGNSTLPPILNAIEIYKVTGFSQSETQQDDGKLVL
jgi:hypothetical protein